MIGIPMYIILPDKISELHTESLWTEQNISHCMEVSSPRKIPYVYIRGPLYIAIKMSLKESEQNLGAGLPYPFTNTLQAI